MPNFLHFILQNLHWGFLLMLNCVLFIPTIHCQNRVADFTITDSEGSIHRLFHDYLDKEKIVVIDIFFADCPPCNTIAPFLKASYEHWGSNQKEIVFISLSPYDTDAQIERFRNAHFFSHPFSGIEGGGDEALKQFTNGNFGPFSGYPVLLIIRLDKTVIYDIHSLRGDEETIDLLDFHIARTIDENIVETKLQIFPNPSYKNPNIFVELIEGGNYSFAIYQLNGKIIVAKNLVFERKGRYDLTSHFSMEDPGIYFLQIKENESIISSEKFIIHH